MNVSSGIFLCLFSSGCALFEMLADSILIKDALNQCCSSKKYSFLEVF